MTTTETLIRKAAGDVLLAKMRKRSPLAQKKYIARQTQRMINAMEDAYKLDGVLGWGKYTGRIQDASTKRIWASQQMRGKRA